MPIDSECCISDQDVSDYGGNIVDISEEENPKRELEEKETDMEEIKV